MLYRKLSASLIGVALLTCVAQAQDIALAKNSMRLFGGPSLDYPRIGLIAWGQGVKVLGCETHSGWCEIVADGQRGWVPGARLTWPSSFRKPIDAPTSRRVTI